MRKIVFIISLYLIPLFSIGQNINGLYEWKGNFKGIYPDNSIIEIRMLNDSTYVQIYKSDSKKEIDDLEKKKGKSEQKGKIRKEGAFYILTNFGKESNVRNDFLIRIRKRKIIIYGKKRIRIGNLKKLKELY